MPYINIYSSSCQSYPYFAVTADSFLRRCTEPGKVSTRDLTTPHILLRVLVECHPQCHSRPPENCSRGSSCGSLSLFGAPTESLRAATGCWTAHCSEYRASQTVFNLNNLDNFNMLYSGYRTCTTVIQPLLHVLLCYCILVAGEQLLHRGDGTLLLVPRSPPWSHLQTCAGEDGSWGRREHNSTANQNQYQVQ